MNSLDDLLGIEGVVVAGQFTSDGKLVDHRSSLPMSPEMAGTMAQFCATVTMMFDTLAGAFTRLSGMTWIPQQCWAYAGGDWVVVVGGERGVFVHREKADMNKLFKALARKG